MSLFASRGVARVFVGFVLLTIAAPVAPTITAHADNGSGTTADSRRTSKRAPKLDLELQRQRRAHRDEMVRVIVTPAAGHWSAALQKRRAHGDAITSEHRIVDAFSATVHVDDLDALDADPDVANVSADAVVTSDAAVVGRGNSAPSSSRPDTRARCGGDGRPQRQGRRHRGDRFGTGTGNRSARRRARQAVRVRRRSETGRPYDDYGHGPHVAGLIGGSGEASEGDAEEVARDGRAHRIKVRVYRGIAPKARIVSLKVLNGDGTGRTSDVIDAIQFAVQNRERLKIDIINLSLGHPIYEPRDTDPLVQAVEAAVRSGIVVVASAGNFGTNPDTGVAGYAGITSPGNAPSAITVGAVDTRGTASRLDDRVASYSSRGPTWYDAAAKPDVVAPGHRLVAPAALRSSLYASGPLVASGRQRRGRTTSCSAARVWLPPSPVESWR